MEFCGGVKVFPPLCCGNIFPSYVIFNFWHENMFFVYNIKRIMKALDFSVLGRPLFHI
jgi:hypothetical protein